MSSKDFTHNNMDIEHSSVYKTSLVKVIFENVEEGIMITNEKNVL